MTKLNLAADIDRPMPKHQPIWPAFLFFFFALISHLFTPAVLTFFMLILALFASAFWIASGQPFPRPLATLLWPLGIIVLLGSQSAFYRDLYDVGKGAWYVGNAGLIMLTGYILMMKSNLVSIMRVLILAALIAAFFHLRQFVQHPETLELGAEDIRNVLGRGYFIPAMAISLCVMSLRGGFPVFGRLKWPFWLVIIICGASLVLSFSRAWYLSAAILIVFLLGVFDSHRWKSSVLFLVLGLAGYGVYSFTVLNYIDLDHKSFFYELARIPQEIYVQEYFSLADINKNWRGYETARAMNTYLQGNGLELVFGQGFGMPVNLGLLMFLGGFYTREAPILHNGYAQLLVAVGPVGVSMYLYLIWQIIRRGYEYTLVPDVKVLYVGRLLMGLGVVFLLTTMTVGGMLNKSALFIGMLMVGALFAYGQEFRAVHERNKAFQNDK